MLDHFPFFSRRLRVRLTVVAMVVAGLVTGVGPTSTPASAHGRTIHTVRCESVNFGGASCGVGGGRITWLHIEVENQLSRTPCVKNVNYGIQRGGTSVWVTAGCRADFKVTDHRQQELTCSSWLYQRRTCDTGGIDPTIHMFHSSDVEQLSTTACYPYNYWVFPTEIIVDNGCRARFTLWYH